MLTTKRCRHLITLCWIESPTLAGRAMLYSTSSSQKRCIERPIPERHRIIFYVGHLEAFDWNLLHENVFGLKSFHPEFDRLFAFGIDPVGGGLPSDQPSDWPSLAHSSRLRARRIRAALDEKFARSDSRLRRIMRDGFPWRILLNVAIEHRLMHVETLAYMLHQLPLDRKVRQARTLRIFQLRPWITA